MPIRLLRGDIHRFMRFVLVGVVNTCFSFSVYALLLYAGAHYAVAVLIANIAGILFNFKTTGRFVFHKKDGRLIYRFIAVYVCVYFLGVALIRVLLSWGTDRYLAGAVTAIPMAVISFALLSVFVFRDREA